MFHFAHPDSALGKQIVRRLVVASAYVAVTLTVLPAFAQDELASPAPAVSEAEQAEALKQLKPEDLVDAPEIKNTEDNATLLSKEVESLKQAALKLNRDLLMLEEDLLFPASTQVALYLSVDVGTYFKLDAVKVKVDDKLVASHLYTDKQNSALVRGGIQRLYMGNLKTGKHEITAFFHGYGPNDREYKRAATYKLLKTKKPSVLEIRVRDSKASQQPEFDFKEWQK